MRLGNKIGIVYIKKQFKKNEGLGYLKEKRYEPIPLMIFAYFCRFVRGFAYKKTLKFISLHTKKIKLKTK